MGEERGLVQLEREGEGRVLGGGDVEREGWERETPPLTGIVHSPYHCSWCQLQPVLVERGERKERKEMTEARHEMVPLVLQNLLHH